MSKPVSQPAYTTYVEFDDKAEQYVVSSSQVPGLGAAHEEITGLMIRIDALTPMLMRKNVFQNPRLPAGYQHTGPLEYPHEVVVLRPDSKYDRIEAAKIDVRTLLASAP